MQWLSSGVRARRSRARPDELHAQSSEWFTPHVELVIPQAGVAAEAELRLLTASWRPQPIQPISTEVFRPRYLRSTTMATTATPTAIHTPMDWASNQSRISAPK